MKTYNPQSSHISSSIGSWVNYMGASEESFKKTRQQVFTDYPDSVIINGNDDWFAPEYSRPETFIRNFGIEVLAYYHSGISGISKSGIVVTKSEYLKLKEKYLEKYNLDLDSKCKIYQL